MSVPNKVTIYYIRMMGWEGEAAKIFAFSALQSLNKAR
jgi:hypothetical protein